MAEVRNKSLGKPVLYALILGGVYLTYLFLSPFLVALTWAIMFAILFRGMQVALSTRIGAKRAALVTTLVVGLAIVAPAVTLIAVFAREAPQVTDYVKQTSRHAPQRSQRFWGAARARSPVALPENPADFMTQGAQRALKFLAPRAGAFVADFFGMLGTRAAMLFALFFMLRDGDTMRRQLRERLPFSDQENERLMSDTRDLVIASIGAGVVVAAAQGVIGGLTFWLGGIREPVFWGGAPPFCLLLP